MERGHYLNTVILRSLSAKGSVFHPATQTADPPRVSHRRRPAGGLGDDST